MDVHRYISAQSKESEKCIILLLPESKVSDDELFSFGSDVMNENRGPFRVHYVTVTGNTRRKFTIAQVP
jgi:hypothetical protein